MKRKDTVQKCADVDRCARLWNITKDAKEGDVLCCESGWTCIFKALGNNTNTFSSYCFMDNTGWFCETGSEAHTLDKAFIKAYNGNIYPATKEQRDIFFQKMKEAGYEWDAEKRELKEIDQKSAWSVEDISKIQRICKYLNEAKKYYADITEIRECIDWFKNLENRVQPHNTWKPSDEQIEALDFAADCIVPAEFNFKRKELKGLLEQLKKLMEE